MATLTDMLTWGQQIIRALPFQDKTNTLLKNADKHPHPGGRYNSWSQHTCEICKSIRNAMEKLQECTVHWPHRLNSSSDEAMKEVKQCKYRCVSFLFETAGCFSRKITPPVRPFGSWWHQYHDSAIRQQ
jgi:hypothetical protein